MTDNNSNTGPASAAMTIRDIMAVHNIKSSTLRMRFPKLGLSNFDVTRKLEPWEIELITNAYAKKTKGAKPLPSPTGTVQKRTPKPKRTWRDMFHLLDVIIWGEIGLGWYSLFQLAGISGLGFGAIAVVFYEYSRQTMHTPYRMLEEGHTRTEYEAAQEYNEHLRKQKATSMWVCVLIACVFCLANWNAFYTDLHQSPTLRGQMLTNTISFAHALATVFAVLMSGVAYVCLRAISIAQQLKTANE